MYIYASSLQKHLYFFSDLIPQKDKNGKCKKIQKTPQAENPHADVVNHSY